ncbi:MAG: hypothetical protein CMN76_10350 [Spirochaetaceae bacterium]|nr:hypothetical protein [Spirochaetaceae bacterium]
MGQRKQRRAGCISGGHFRKACCLGQVILRILPSLNNPLPGRNPGHFGFTIRANPVRFGGADRHLPGTIQASAKTVLKHTCLPGPMILDHRTSGMQLRSLGRHSTGKGAN